MLTKRTKISNYFYEYVYPYPIRYNIDLKYRDRFFFSVFYSPIKKFHKPASKLYQNQYVFTGPGIVFAGSITILILVHEIFPIRKLIVKKFFFYYFFH